MNINIIKDINKKVVKLIINLILNNPILIKKNRELDLNYQKQFDLIYNKIKDKTIYSYNIYLINDYVLGKGLEDIYIRTYLEDYEILITSKNENFDILLDFYGIEDIRKLINKLYIFQETIYIKENILQLQAISVCNNLIKSKFRRPFNITEDILCEY